MLLWEEAVSDKTFSNDRVYVISFVLASGRIEFMCIISWRTEPQFLAWILQHTYFWAVLYLCVGGIESLCAWLVRICVYAAVTPGKTLRMRSSQLSSIIYNSLLPQLPYILSRSSPPRLDHHHHAACSPLDTFLRSARFLQLLSISKSHVWISGFPPYTPLSFTHL